MKLIKKYIKDFILHNNFLRNFIRNFDYLNRRIHQLNSLTSPVLNFNEFIENKYKENLISFFDIGCFGTAPHYLADLKNFSFYGIDIDTKEIERQKKHYSSQNFEFFNYKVVKPDNLENLREKFNDTNSNQNLYTLEEVQGYSHEKTFSNFSKNQNFSKNNFTNEIITIDNAYKNLIYPKEINFLKIDIDANDHEVLYGADNLLDSDRLFGIQIEVDYVKAKGRKFRNFIEVLRYMNHKKFNLHNFINNKYSSDFLPTKYLYSFPGPNENGSPLSGDLIFFKHFDNQFLNKLNNDDYIKILRLLEIYNQDHIAIELINNLENFSDNIKNEFKSELIKKYSLDFFGEILNYEQYREKYIQNKDKFLNIL